MDSIQDRDELRECAMESGFSVSPASLRQSGGEIASVGAGLDAGRIAGDASMWGGDEEGTVYDDAGNAIKRVDLTGRSHGGVPTPHVVEYTVHRNPQTGQVFVRENRMARSATPEEIP